MQVLLQRLQTRQQFQAALAGSVVSKTPHFALHRGPLVPDATGAQVQPNHYALGAMVPKRWARRAVTRNAIKRQIYNLGAQGVPPLPATAHVVRLRAAYARAQFPSASSAALKAAVRLELQQLFSKAPTP